MSFPPDHLKPGQWLKQRRRKLKLTQKEFGEKVGISEATVSSLEAGRRPFSEDVAQRLVRFLEIPPDEQAATIAFLRGTNRLRPGLERAEAEASPALPAIEVLAVTAPPVALAQPAMQRRGYTLWVGIGGVLLGVLLTLLAVGVAWSENQPATETMLNGMAAPLTLRHTRICTNQPANSDLIWDNVGNFYNLCHMLGNTITITPSINTILDGTGEYRRTAPLLYRGVRGDFRATVKMDYVVDGECCRHAGLGVRLPNDDRTWLRITKTSQTYKIISEGLLNGRPNQAQVSENDRPVVRAQVVYFKIERKGNVISVFYSLDGQDWILYFPYTVDYAEEVEVFLFAHASSGSPNLPATFTDFTVTPLPAP